MSVVVKAVAKWYTGKLGARLSKLGLTYHDVVSDTGVFDQGISRLSPEMKVRGVSRVVVAYVRSAARSAGRAPRGRA